MFHNDVRHSMRKTITLADEAQPRNVQRADVEPVQRSDLEPTDGFSLVIDGHFKTHYDVATTSVRSLTE